MNERIKAVLFDHDDTLVATREAKFAHNKHVAKTFYGIELTDEDILPHWGKPFSQMIGILFQTDDTDQAMTNVVSCRDDFPKALYDGTISVLNQLRNSGTLTGVVTSSVIDSFKHDLELHNIPRNIFDYVQTEEDTQFHKPDPRVFIPTSEWLVKQGIKPHEVVYVGDGLHDAAAAQGAGFGFIGVETGFVTKAQFKKHGIKSVPSVNDIMNLIH